MAELSVELENPSHSQEMMSVSGSLESESVELENPSHSQEMMSVSGSLESEMAMDCSESQDIDGAKDSVQTDYSMPDTLCSNTQDMKTVTGSLDSVSAEPDEGCLNGNPSINDLNDNATDGMFSARCVRESPAKKIGSQDGKISVQIFVGEINIYGQQSAADHVENKQMKRKHGTTSKEIESKCKRAMRSALRDVGNNAKENGS